MCEQTYGFLPCSSTALGNLFLIVVYGSLMYLAATYLSTGSELLLEILGPGLVGGLLLPILGALPDAMLILVSGISGSVETAQSQVSVGMGLLAGSTVMLLTIVWGTCIIVGKCDIENNIAVDSKDSKGFNLTGSGVSTDIWTSYAGIIMAVSVIPFLVVQLPQSFSSTSLRNLAVLIALIVSVSLLISYCLYQVFQPWIQSRRLHFAKHKHVVSGILIHLKRHALGRLCNDDGTPNEDILRKLFTAIDVNDDDSLSQSELKALIVGLRLEDINLEEDNAVEKVMQDFDTSLDSKIQFTEFVDGVKKWLEKAKGAKASGHKDGPGTTKHLDNFHEETKKEHYLLGDQSDQAIEGVDNPRWTYLKAVLLLLLGTVIAAAFADPLIYGAVTMNNVLCLSVFLALVYVRGLTWDFSSEVLVILVVCVVMGVFASMKTTFPLWTSLLAFLLYPLSLAFVYVLDYVFGWT
ncbi:hypothetical protein Leryth_010063 [Lithospermum erythrorhizon]|nr:hypothetical protein Leryth_010063 [Lithospermum erythrorhizon]